MKINQVDLEELEKALFACRIIYTHTWTPNILMKLNKAIQTMIILMSQRDQHGRILRFAPYTSLRYALWTNQLPQCVILFDLIRR